MDGRRATLEMEGKALGTGKEVEVSFNCVVGCRLAGAIIVTYSLPPKKRMANSKYEGTIHWKHVW